MDGTLIDSTAGVVGAWNLFKQTYPGIDVHNILSSAHGVRTVETLRKYCGLTDPDEIEREAERFEKSIVTTSSEGGRQGIVLLPGVKEIISSLAPHVGRRWTICTSATRSYATSALEIVGIDRAESFVYAEDVQKGKPMPDPYLLGASKLGVDPTKCLVVEDAPAGVRSGHAAGCKTLGVVTSHSREVMEAVSPTFLVDKLDSVTMTVTDAGVEVTITTPST
ncbi:phosphatase [Peniophora sp. CONT]|nr:phosphatase [Peniophora sp. CONT]